MERLDKFLTNAGVATRSQIKAILKTGRVQVDGKPVKDGSVKIDPEKCVRCKLCVKTCPANAISGTCMSGKPFNSEADKRKRALSNKLKTILQGYFLMILKLQVLQK